MIETAIQAAKMAAKIQIEKFGSILQKNVDQKGEFDFVTQVDLQSEKTIIELIKKRFPEHGIMAEESLGNVDRGEYRWIIDPLDGTTNYIHGYPVFSISIALQYKREIILGVVHDPLRGDLFYAEKGKGAYLNDQPVHVSQTSDMGKCLLATGFPFRSKQYLEPYLESFRQIFLIASGVRRLGSAALDFAYIGCGRCDGFWEIGLSPWDIAAGSIIIKEAGGIVTDFAGGGNFLNTGDVVASNGKIHDHILEIVADVFNGILNE